ncbi:PIN domain-containing protein [Mucilaginibacter sp. UR6-1]|uniref:type II toxin-antitoxin system VapC family toxin n=1 Tax=Mucilaginibacter sp. UR6-1 TaxID=1435643 RepID=UPI001E3B0950|nr:PIN domain-containing protein [Mucilaginibacter sp. UR6-1]MCC8410960.1 PIN domain-containing protein [Mucilaginibacter sp. UR6-1]
MKLIFIDSDILLDALLERETYAVWAKGLLRLLDGKNYTGCTSVHSLLNIHYLLKKRVGEKPARASIKLLSDNLRIIAEDGQIIKQAIVSDFGDFEDAVQYYSAANAKADAIITRNIKDYKHATLPVLSAEQFLRSI